MICGEDPLRRSWRNRQQVKTTGGVCLNGGKYDRTAFQTEAARQNQASDGCTGDGVPPAVDQRYDFHEFGCHLGNVAKVYFGAASVFTNRPIGLKMYQNSHAYMLHRKIIPHIVWG